MQMLGREGVVEWFRSELVQRRDRGVVAGGYDADAPEAAHIVKDKPMIVVELPLRPNVGTNFGFDRNRENTRHAQMHDELSVVVEVDE